MKKNQKITVIEYVHTADGGLARVDQLGPEDYEKFRRWLACTWLNGLYRGKAEFCYPEAAGEKQQATGIRQQAIGDGGDGSFDFASLRSG